ncbi:glycoside hydrolase family 32 protein [Hymenobacter sp. 15J16-1T3B]|uniref:glycoside hydrolase family 32 protein n=1 Tax=Hymenobacter sp. 15J16-1T3B TaxID=2886941 RepID=UPI001D116071|nr:glycoside hydrolase family 32 protein [Hymenobacter sp. 15J16-1T3B]MCC3159152.1 glycoside hydrolase family 32 protein [Hymenobacter sp. 15J16-1T3B]
MKRLLLALSLLTAAATSHAQTPAANIPPATPQYRPAYHFSPAQMWMNDPNGMVYVDGTYHLFFQHYPEAMVWGPMHWGHATSTDLVHWQQQPIALFPDKLGWIFSGSAVVDKDNTAGFGKNALVAIFTHHNDPEEKRKTNKHQYQSLAYSTDGGQTWTKYAGNPVLPNPGIPDFRDPKVSWNPQVKKWIMTLATKDRITFYSSPNLKTWAKESEFGAKLGAHGGVWECPDLFPLTVDGQTKWVLLVSINPGGPNGGSATQYFLGQFDGHTFRPDQAAPPVRWVDYGKDNYAGVTWNNAPGGRRLFLGWMSNWQYANQVPTSPWRNAMTVPRELALKRVGKEVYLTSRPAREVAQLMQPGAVHLTGLPVKTELDLTTRLPQPLSDKMRIELSTAQLADFALVLGNQRGEELLIGYDQKANQYFVDRSKAGPSGFSKDFAGRHPAPRRTTAPAADLTLLFDASSVEVFADGGLTTLTELFFPSEPYTTLKLRSSAGLVISEFDYAKLAPDAN